MMRKIPRPLRQIFRPVKPRSSVIEQGLVMTSILAAIILAVTALIVHRINNDAAEAGTRSIRSIEIAATLDKLQLALRDGDMAGRDLVSGKLRDRSDVERFDSARFLARLNLTALGPLTSDQPAQSERLSRLSPLINKKFALGLRSYEATTPGARDEIDGLIAAMRDDESHRLDAYRATQANANERSTWMMVAALALVSLLSLAFWMLLKIEFKARRALEERLIQSATTDELTGVANRSDFDHKLVQEWEFRLRYGTALSLLVVDVDKFKELNEQWGHVAGDSILREVARRLASRLRRAELLARSGGDEFAIIVPHYRKEAMALAEQLREQVAEAPFFLQGRDRPVSLKVTVSIGVAEASDVDTPRQLLAAADEATYAAKDRGRNVVESYRANLTTGGGIRVSTLDRDKAAKPMATIV
jgi:diguanylate cyclase (GGDEF)-like protein